jgi:hypothetical protein
MDFSKIKINCSSLSSIMADDTSVKPISEIQQAELDRLLLKAKITPKQEEKVKSYLERKANFHLRDSSLTDGAKKSLIDIYVAEKYGKKIPSSGRDYSLGVINGSVSEFRSLELVSNFTGEEYKVNKDLIFNKYIKGKLDAYTGKSLKNAEKVIEIKTAQSMNSLLDAANNKKLIDTYYWQLMGYMYLTNSDVAEIYHVVVTYDQNIITESINRYLNRVKGMGLPKEKVEQEIESIRNNLTFDEIPASERIVKLSLERDDEQIDRIKYKVKAARKYLKEFEKIHLNINNG